MNIIKINDNISYIEEIRSPLSADVGIINNSLLYDVGASDEVLANLNGKYDVCLSHFHKDHIANLAKIKINRLYVSKETYRHLPKDLNTKEIIIVEDEITIDNLRLFKLPSSHAKGSLALEVDNAYCFIGDGSYPAFKNNKAYYNAQLLKEEIEILKGLKGKYLLLSHYKGLIRDKNAIINERSEIYLKRIKNEAEIIINY